MECGRSDCSAPATTRVIGTMSKTWSGVYCPEHVDDGVAAMQDMGMSDVQVEAVA